MPRTKARLHMRRAPLTVIDLETCEDCGAQLTSDESIARHRGLKCHTKWMEKRITELELQVELTRAAVAILMKDSKHVL
jgi:hypothetical protein